MRHAYAGWRLASRFAVSCLVIAGCSEANTPPSTPETLEDLGLFSDAVAQTPADDVIAYEVNAVLFSDESYKLRFLQVPDGQTATYDATGLWGFPDGTRFVKTFYFPLDERDPSGDRRLLETRIIEKTDGEWSGRTYVWNDAQTETVRVKAGQRTTVEWIDKQGDARELVYRIPNDNECKTCHALEGEFEPLGPRTRQMNRDYDYGTAELPRVENQIDHLRDLGLLVGDIPLAMDRFSLVDPYGDADLETRARSYLDANCSHCHRPGGEAGSAGLDLRMENVEQRSLGICKAPVAAGPGSGQRAHDIVPGDPDASILVFRMESTDPSIKMPELPTITSDADGVALIREWITAMPSDGCP